MGGPVRGTLAEDYLRKRGITEATARAFDLGYAPDSRAKLRTALKAIGDGPLVETGLLIQVEGKEPYDRFRGRLTIPIRDPRGRVIAWGARIIGETMAASNPARVMTAMAMKSDPATNAIRGITAAADMSEEQMDSC